MAKVEKLLLLVLVTTLSLSPSVSASPSEKSSAQRRCVSGFCLPAGYNRLEAPKGVVTEVDTSMMIQDLVSVDDNNFSVSVYAYLGIGWFEPRLEYTDGASPPPGTGGINIDPEFIKYLWFPNLIIAAVKDFKPVSELRPQTLLKIREDQNLTESRRKGFKVIYMQAVVITFLCRMRFEPFPLDHQKCQLVFAPNYETSQVVMTKTLLRYKPEYKRVILEYEVAVTELDPKALDSNFGNYSLSGIEIMLQRYKLKYITNFYLPSGLFVAVSWASFLIPPEIVAGRMAMLITLFLVLINIFLGMTIHMPNAEGVTAMSAYIIVCILFVFGALCAYAFLLWRLKPTVLFKTCSSFPGSPNNRVKSLRRDEDESEEGSREENNRMATANNRSGSSNSKGGAAAGSQKRRTDSMMDGEGRSYFANRGQNSAKQRVLVDDACLLAFPLIFAVFNVLYWCICLNLDAPLAEGKIAVPMDEIYSHAKDDEL